MSLHAGLQMFSVRDQMAIDPLETVRNVIEMGYLSLEFANLSAADRGVGFRVDPAELREVMDGLGAHTLSTHVMHLDSDSAPDLIAFHRELGTRYLTAKLMYRTLDDIEELAASINSVGDQLLAAGMAPLVHTSLIRERGDGRTDLDELLDRLAPQFRNIELDTYWIHRSGLSIIEVIERYGESIRVIHQKDLPRLITQPVNIVNALPADSPLDADSYYLDARFVSPDNFTELGSGVLPLQEIIDATIAHTNAGHVLVEQDFSALPSLESVRRSLAQLSASKGIVS
jgi:sugar phosphate isomerase/epimerase